jgi:hypothetical protein
MNDELNFRKWYVEVIIRSLYPECGAQPPNFFTDKSYCYSIKLDEVAAVLFQSLLKASFGARKRERR